MSSHDKDPFEKQDSSDSSESSSDSDVNKAEENLEHLKIKEEAKDDSSESYLFDSPKRKVAIKAKEEAKDDSSGSYLFDSPKRKATIKEEAKDDSSGSYLFDSPKRQATIKVKEEAKDASSGSYLFDSPKRKVATGKHDPQNEAVAGPSGIQKSNVAGTDDGSGQDPKVGSTDPREQKQAEAEDDDGASNAEGGSSEDKDKMIEGDSDTTSSTPPFIQSSTGITPSIELDGKSSGRGPPRDYAKFDARLLAYRFLGKTSNRSSSSKRTDYASDSANTSADVSEIRSEIADISVDGSLYQDAPEDFEKEESPSFVSAPESREKSSEGSDTNYSELQDEVAPPRTPDTSSAVTTSTPSGEEGHRAYLARLQREAEALGPPISSSSGIGSTNMSELVHRKAWELAGEMGSYRRNEDDMIDLPDPGMLGRGAEGREPSSESMEDERPELGRQMQAFDRLFEERVEEPNVPQDATSRRVARRAQEGVVAPGEGMPSPSKRRRQSKGSTETDKLQGFEPDSGRKSKMVARKQSPGLQSGSGSSGPKSSYTDERHRKDSPEIESEGQESGKAKKSWQNPGMLRKMQLSKMASKESVIAEEQDPVLSETAEPTPEEGVASNIELSDPRPSIESSDQAYGSDGTLKGQESSLELSEVERSVGKSKRGPKLSSSPPSDEKPSSPSDEKQGSTPPKAATSRPKKKARADKIPVKTRRTRHDSDGSVPKSVSLSSQSDSASTPDISDYTPSDEEKETAL